MLIDTHTHLYAEQFDGDRDETLQRAAEAGVAKVILPAIDSASHEGLFAMSETFAGICYPLMGLHPTSVNDNPAWHGELDAVERLLRGSARGGGMRFYGVGEIGMDLYWSTDFAAEQEEAFCRQIELALELSLPVIIHTREAWPVMREILASYSGRGLKGIMHSFSGTLDDYRFILGCGDFMFGIGGPVTYKNSQLAEILPSMDLERLVLETDSPYLPPVPYRGKRNESSYLTYICGKVAEVMGLSIATVAETTTANALRMFGI